MEDSNDGILAAIRRALLGTLLAAAISGQAATLLCNDKPNRYKNPNIFGSVKQTANIQFGQAINPLHANAVEKLAADIFQPVGDTCTKRPLVIFMWGGGFQSGQRQDETGDCQNFARRGFVCATTDYRKGNVGSYNIPNFCGPTFMSGQDTRAAIRFFKKNATQYGIDSNFIFVGGCSSGAYAAMHTAYWDKDSEIPSWLDAKFTVGGTEGVSGNPGFGSRPAGVLSLSGGLFDSTWVNRGDVPLAAVYCTQDPIESPDQLHDGNGDGRAFISNYDANRLTARFKRQEVPILLKPIPGGCHCPHPIENGTDGTIDFLSKSAFTIMSTQPVSVRMAVALSAGDLKAMPEGALYDVKGGRVELRGLDGNKGPSNPPTAFHPGLYFRSNPATGAKSE